MYEFIISIQVNLVNHIYFYTFFIQEIRLCSKLEKSRINRLIFFLMQFVKKKKSSKFILFFLTIHHVLNRGGWTNGDKRKLSFYNLPTTSYLLQTCNIMYSHLHCHPFAAPHTCYIPGAKHSLTSTVTTWSRCFYPCHMNTCTRERAVVSCII